MLRSLCTILTLGTALFVFGACGDYGAEPKTEATTKEAAAADSNRGEKSAMDVANEVAQNSAKEIANEETPAPSGPSHHVTYYMLSKG